MRLVSLSSSRDPGYFPLFLSLARKQAVTVGEALKEGREKGRFFPRRPGITTKKDAIFEAKSGERSDHGETFLDSSLRAVVKRFCLSFSFAAERERERERTCIHIYRKAMPYS